MSADNPIEARPRTEEEIATLPHCPEILEVAKKRGISSVVHFTTLAGCVGVLATQALKSRYRLPEEKYLEHIYQPNAHLRKDQAWLDYVNLSVERINDWMFDTSVRWHPEEIDSWVVLNFDLGILTHPGVVFTTTNNIYPSCRRAEDLCGFNRMFAHTVLGRYGSVHERIGKPESWTTDRQAEVLYPAELSSKYLKQIDVQVEETIDRVHGALANFEPNIPVRYAPEVFQ